MCKAVEVRGAEGREVLELNQPCRGEMCPGDQWATVVGSDV